MNTQAPSKNVVDWYKEMDDRDIIADLDKTRLPAMIVTENVNGDFHKANILRSAEANNLHSFWVVGGRRMDMRAAVGTQNRMVPQKVDTLADLPIPDGYRVVAVDNVPGAVSVYDYKWEPNTVMVFGEEQRGLSQDALDFADDKVYIPMRGAVRSFSVSTAAGILMYEYTRQMVTAMDDD